MKEIDYLSAVNTLIQKLPQEIPGYIDAFHDSSPLKGVPFYNNLVRATIGDGRLKILPHIRRAIREHCALKCGATAVSQSGKVKRDTGADTRKPKPLFDLLPDYSQDTRNFIAGYSNKTPAGIGALIVALKLHKHGDNEEVLRSMKAFFNITSGFSRQLIFDHHVFNYDQADRVALVTNKKYKELKKIREAIKG